MTEYQHWMKIKAADLAKEAEISRITWSKMAVIALSISLYSAGTAIALALRLDFPGWAMMTSLAIFMLWSARVAMRWGRMFSDQFLRIRQQALDYANE